MNSSGTHQQITGMQSENKQNKISNWKRPTQDIHDKPPPFDRCFIGFRFGCSQATCESSHLARCQSVRTSQQHVRTAYVWKVAARTSAPLRASQGRNWFRKGTRNDLSPSTTSRFYHLLHMEDAGIKHFTSRGLVAGRNHDILEDEWFCRTIVIEELEDGCAGDKVDFGLSC